MNLRPNSLASPFAVNRPSEQRTWLAVRIEFCPSSLSHQDWNSSWRLRSTDSRFSFKDTGVMLGFSRTYEVEDESRRSESTKCTLSVSTTILIAERTEFKNPREDLGSDTGSRSVTNFPVPIDTTQSMLRSGNRHLASCTAIPQGLFAQIAPSWKISSRSLYSGKYPGAAVVARRQDQSGADVVPGCLDFVPPGG